jgi:hypothetical protein
MIILHYRTGNKKTPWEMAVTQGAYKGTQCKNKIRQFKEIKGGSLDYLLSESGFVSDLI